MKFSRTIIAIFNRIDRIFSVLTRIYFFVAITAILWASLLGMFTVYAKVGDKDALDFIWQIIGFDVVVATLLLGIQSPLLRKERQPVVSLIAVGFLLTAILLIISYGIGLGGEHTPDLQWLVIVGAGCVLITLLIMAICLALLLYVAIESARESFQKEPRVQPSTRKKR